MANKQKVGCFAPDESQYVTCVDGGGNLQHQYQYLNIVGAGTTVVKSGSGFLKSLIVNKAVVASATTLFDNTAGSGTKIATITNPAVALLQSQFELTFECIFNTGLTIVTSAADDITVVFT